MPEVQTIILDLKHRGIGVLITDHNVRETLRIVDRGYIIAKGKVLTEGTGKAIAHGDILVADLKSQVWTDDGTEIKPYIDTFTGGRGLIRPIEQIVPGVSATLPGVKGGCRVPRGRPRRDRPLRSARLGPSAGGASS